MKKIIFGFILFLFVGLSQTFAEFTGYDEEYSISEFNTILNSSGFTNIFDDGTTINIKIIDWYLKYSVNNGDYIQYPGNVPYFVNYGGILFKTNSLGQNLFVIRGDNYNSTSLIIEMQNLTLNERWYGGSSSFYFGYNPEDNFFSFNYNSYKVYFDSAWTYTDTGGNAEGIALGGYVFYTNYGPPVLDILSNGTIINYSNGIQLQGFETNTDFSLTYQILKYDSNNNFTIEDVGDLGTQSGGLIDLNFYNHNNFVFKNLGLYDLCLYLTDINNGNIIERCLNADYTYNSGYLDPQTLTYSFFTSGLTTFENGFSLDNFVPSPYGGNLYFEIIAPNPTGTGTINITTQKYKNYEIDGFGYGFDSNVKVTFPYHKVPGTYQVRSVYEYQSEKVYPFGTDYNSYLISVGESRYTLNTDEAKCDTDLNGELSDLEINNCASSFCDSDSNGEVGIGEGITCIPRTIGYIISKIFNYIKNVYGLIDKIGESFTSEVKTFSFIGSASAENIIVDSVKNNVDQEAFDLTFFGKLVIFIKGFLVFMVLLIGVLVFLKISRGKND